MQKCADPTYHPEDRKYKTHKETTKTTTPEVNNQTAHSNKQTKDEFVTYSQSQKTGLSRRRKKQRHKQSIPKAHATSEK